MHACATREGVPCARLLTVIAPCVMDGVSNALFTAFVGVGWWRRLRTTGRGTTDGNFKRVRICARAW